MHAARLEHETQSRETSGPTGPGAPCTAAPRGVYIGCSGWYYRHWANDFYPPELSSSRWFDHYASNFRTVELNAPFYSWPTLKTVGVWNRQAGERDFTFNQSQRAYNAYQAFCSDRHASA
ncbi:MAG TPA: DUF72 domain-containing protein, partial [Casimicrobiaceae bacterium]|nr:DUF72 domain-containing protein [Casimicrobiaceae bacterium]